MQIINHPYSPFINELALINYENLGTPKQELVISRIIQNWDNRRYLKPKSSHLLGTHSRSIYLKKSYKFKM